MKDNITAIAAVLALAVGVFALGVWVGGLVSKAGESGRIERAKSEGYLLGLGHNTSDIRKILDSAQSGK